MPTSSLKERASSRMAEEVVNEIMMAGIAFLLIVSGVNYFNMKWSWTQILAKAGAASGIAASTAGTEVTGMLASLANTFPFKYLFAQYDFLGALIIAVCLTVLGVGLKVFTVRTKGKFVIDLGKNIYQPAIFGLLAILLLQLWTAFNVDEYLTTHKLAHPEFTSGYFVWQTYGQLFLLGAALLVIGAIIKLVGEKNKANKTLLVGNTMFNGAFILLIYYFIIRILAFDVVTQSSVGKIIKLLIISNQYSGFTIMVCIFMYAFGKELRGYGVAMLKHEKRMHSLAEMKQNYDFMKREYGAKPAQHAQHQQHPKQLKVEPHHLRPHTLPHQHATQKYVMPEKEYRHGRS